MKIKNILKILFLTVGFIVIISIYNTAKANTIDSVNIVINITEDGTAHVTEEWQATLDEGNELKHVFNNLDVTEISNLKILDEYGNTFALEGTWNNGEELDSTRLKCALITNKERSEIHWGIGEYSSNAYFIEYDITNFIHNLADGNQMMKFTFFEKEREEIGHVGINIMSDNLSFTDIAEVYGKGYENGLCQINSLGEIYYSSLGKLETKESVTILARFNGGSFEKVASSINHEFDFYLRDMLGNSDSDSVVNNKVIIVTLLVFIFAGVIIFIIVTARK